MTSPNKINSEKLSDRLAEVNSEEITPLLLKRGSDLREIAKIIGRLPRTGLSITLCGLVDRVGIEIERISDAPYDAEHTGRAVRNCLETNLIGRYVMDSNDNLENWVALRIQEEIDIYASALKVFGKDSFDRERELVDKRIRELKEKFKKYEMPAPKRIPRWRDLAQKYDMLDDYDGLYGIFSKYVHPCAWLIVKPDLPFAEMFAQTFVAHAQLYAADLTTRSLNALNIDETLLSNTSWGSAPRPRVTH